MITTRDLLSLSSLSNIRLLAGEAGLSRIVTWPYVILCPPIGEWVSGGEFLIYYGANLVVEKVDLQQLVREAAENNASGILFLTGEHYILEENLDEDLRRLADELSMPVFSHTSLAFVNSITKDISDAILHSSHSENLYNPFWYSLFFGKADTNDIETLNKAISIGYTPDYMYCVYLLQIRNPEEYYRLQGKKHGRFYQENQGEFNRMIASKCSFFLHKDLGEDSWHLAQHTMNVFLIPVNTPEKEKQADLFFTELCRRLEQQYPGTLFTAAKGTPRNQLSGIRISFLQAIHALQAYPLMPDNPKLVRYRDLGFYQLLFEIPSAEPTREFVSDMLGPLLEYDQNNQSSLLDTLSVYLHCRCNQVQTAKELFLHRNTLLSRLEKIEKLTGHSLSDADDLFHFEAALRIRRFLNRT